MPEVLECFAVSGEADYLLRIVAPDLAAFSDLMMKRLLTLPGVAQVKTNIALSKVKETHELPLDHVAQPAAEAAGEVHGVRGFAIRRLRQLPCIRDG
jgi:Lrp/AsnC family leucine-responsive transcriptional regulator